MDCDFDFTSKNFGFFLKINLIAFEDELHVGYKRKEESKMTDPFVLGNQKKFPFIG